MNHTGMNVHIHASTMVFDSRIDRITSSLVERGVFQSVLIVGIWNSGLVEREQLDSKRTIIRVKTTIPSKRQGLIGKIARTLEWYVRVALALPRDGVACINCHSLPTLALCVVLKQRYGCKLVYDTHELETETAPSRGFRRLVARLVERALIHYADEVSVVNHAIADWYRNRYRFPRVWSIRNLPRASANAFSTARTGRLRRALQVRADDALFLYQGVMDEGRGVEFLTSAFSGLPPQYHLAFLGYGALEEHVRRHVREFQNIHFHPAVPRNELREVTGDADVGLCLIEPICLSYELCLPNKLFEYVAAGVPVLGSDLPCIRETITDLACGWVCALDIEQFRRLVMALTPAAVAQAREGSLSARSRVSWEQEERLLLSLYATMGFPSSAESSGKL
jgi:glycosyltransferase involved in cell wall biosynthesis